MSPIELQGTHDIGSCIKRYGARNCHWDTQVAIRLCITSIGDEHHPSHFSYLAPNVTALQSHYSFLLKHQSHVLSMAGRSSSQLASVPSNLFISALCLISCSWRSP